MADEEVGEMEQLPLLGAGGQLRQAREDKGMSLEQVASKTRITLRHLELIEEGAFISLPGKTYAVGFARNFARAVGADEEAVVASVREDYPTMATEGLAAERSSDFGPGDPGKVPSVGLAIISLVAVVLLSIGAYSFYTSYYGAGSGPGSLISEQVTTLVSSDEGESDEALPAATGGPVVFTALEEGIWVRFYDGAGNVLLEKLMAKQETWTVPQDSVNPQVRTGRPDAFGITIGGRSVPMLGDEPRVVSDIGISAEALLARDTAKPSILPES